MNPVGIVLAAGVGVSLGFFGGGGSILTVPLLVYVFGLEPKPAIASSLLVVAIASTTGAVAHLRAGNVRPRTAALFGSAGMVGAYVGGRASALIDGSVLLLLFASMMVLTALAMWRGRRAPGADVAAGAPTSAGDVARLLVQGGVVGSFTGLVGAGGGFLIVPALSLWAGLPLQAAVGTSLVVIVMNCIAGFSGYAAHVTVDPVLVGSVAGSAVVGSIGGAALAHRVAPASLRRAFAGFVLAMGATILLREGAAVAEAAAAALPHTAPQVLFVLVAVAAGVMAGRASQRGGQASGAPRTFEQGEGI
jgi:uncharacterized membrane protein YfcA